ncbi:MAG: DUF2085 domain-containing protein [Anaerolineae bacterium]|nr:DUF2085 domain-containing protein [Anaerolineae bacterium]
MDNVTPSALHSRRLIRWVAAFTGIVLGAYLALTPGGLLAKADMVGYAVCHRIPSHSFFVGGRQLPLCARCSGTFLGALTGLFGQAVVLKRRRDSGLPPIPIVILLVAFIGIMGADGLNSYLTLIPGAPYLYEPQQWLRIITGSLNGLTLSALIYPIFNLSFWRRPAPTPAVRNLRDVGILLLLEAAMVTLVMIGWTPLLFPLAVLSALGVLTMLTFVNTVLVMMATGWENRYQSLREAAPPLLLGFSLALLQVGAIDVLRYLATGTLNGFPGLS